MTSRFECTAARTRDAGRRSVSPKLALLVAAPLAIFAVAPGAHAQTAGEPIGPKDPMTKPPPGAVVTGTTDGSPSGSGAGDESGRDNAPGTRAIVSETPTNVQPERMHGDFMDTRLTWTFGDDDILHRTGSTQPLSPLPSIGDRPQYRLFFDNLNSRFSGRENVTHLVLYRQLPSWIPNLDTEASLVLRFDMGALAAQNGNLNQSLYDAGSFLRVFYRTGGPDTDKHGLGLTFYPLDTDRFRLGYLYDISWGGTNAAINQSIFPKLVGSSPGMKVQYDFGSSTYAFFGFKTAQIVQPQTNLRPGTSTGNEVEVVRVQESNYGFLGGLGADLGTYFHADAGVGYFQQGRFEFPDLRPPPDTDRQSPRVFTYGASGRIVFHNGMAVPQSLDFQLYRNDPNAPMKIFAPEIYKRDELAYSVALEATQLEQNLHDPNPNKTGATKLQAARALALNGIVKAGFSRLSLAMIYRDLPYILRNVPGFVPFEATDPSARTQSEIFFAGSFDYYIEKLHLRPGFGGGLQIPATFSSTTHIGNADADHTVVVRQQGVSSILPENEGRKPIIQARVSMRWDISDIMAGIFWLQLVHDPMGTLVTRDPQEGTVGIRTFQSPNFFGFGLTLQARY